MLEKELIEAAERDWEQTKEAERPKKTFVYAYIGNHMSIKTYEVLAMIWKAVLVLGAPLLLLLAKYLLGF